MIINNKFDLNQIVYLRTDMEQLARQIVGIRIDANHTLMYLLVAGVETTWHYETELTEDKNYNI